MLASYHSGIQSEVDKRHLHCAGLSGRNLRKFLKSVVDTLFVNIRPSMLWEVLAQFMGAFTLLELDHCSLISHVDVEVRQRGIQGGWQKTVSVGNQSIPDMHKRTNTLLTSTEWFLIVEMQIGGSASQACRD